VIHSREDQPDAETEHFTKVQAAFCVGFPEDLRCGFPNCSAYWRTIVVFGVKRRKTKPARHRRV